MAPLYSESTVRELQSKGPKELSFLYTIIQSSKGVNGSGTQRKPEISAA